MYQFSVSNCLNFLNIEKYPSFRAFQRPYNGHGPPLEVFHRLPGKSFSDFPTWTDAHDVITGVIFDDIFEMSENVELFRADCDSDDDVDIEDYVEEYFLFDNFQVINWTCIFIVHYLCY